MKFVNLLHIGNKKAFAARLFHSIVLALSKKQKRFVPGASEHQMMSHLAMHRAKALPDAVNLEVYSEEVERD